MAPFLLGTVALLLLLWAATAFSNADPKQVARVLRWIGGVTALLLAAFLLFRGEAPVAIPIGAFGLGLLGWTPFGRRLSRHEHKKPRGRLRGCARLTSKWSLIMTPAECMAAFWRATIKALRLMRWTEPRCWNCCAKLIRTAAIYSRPIWIVESLAGAKRRSQMRVPAREQETPVIWAKTKPIRSLALRLGLPPKKSVARIAL